MPVELDNTRPLPRVPMGTGIPDAPEVPSFAATVAAGFRQENLAASAIDAFRLKPFEPDLEPHNPFDTIKGTKYEADHMDRFVGSRSLDETQYIMGRIDREDKDRETLHAAGWGGIAAGIAGGTFDPTLFIPLAPVLKTAAVAGKVIRTSAKTAAFTGGLVGAQETGLQATQELRTAEETALNIGMGTIVGGFLGGASRLLSNAEHAAITAKMEEVRKGFSMDPDNLLVEVSAIDRAIENAGISPDKNGFKTRLERETSISPVVHTTIPLSEAGAASSAFHRGSGDLESALGLEKALSRTGPTLRIASSMNQQVRNTGQELTEMAGLSLKENALGHPTSEGGAVESIIKQPYGAASAIMEDMDDVYSTYYWGAGNEPVVAKRTRTRMGSEWAKRKGTLNGKLSASEFREEIGKAIRHGDKHPIPEVEAIAKKYRDGSYEPIRKRAVKAGMLDEDTKVVGDHSFLNRVYNRDAIIADLPEWKAALFDNLSNQRTEAATKLAFRNRDRVLRLSQDIADLKLSATDRSLLLKSLPEDLKGLEKDNPAFVNLDKSLNELRSKSRKARKDKDTDTAKTLNAEVKTLAKDAGDSYAQYKEARNIINRRLKNVRNNITGKEGAVEKLRGKIADIENSNVTRLWKMHEGLANIEKRIASADPEILLDELESLRNKFAALSDTSDAAYARLAESKERLKARAENDVSKGRLEKAAGAEEKFDREIDKFEKAQSRRVGDQTETARAIDILEQADPEEIISELRGLIEKRISQTAEYIENSTSRMMKLIQRMEKSDPSIVRERVRVLEDRVRSGEYRSKLAEMDDLEARDMVTGITNHILGEAPYRLAGLDLVQGPQGSLRARTLDINSDLIEKFLENDIVKVHTMYVRTMSPDIAIAEKFGDVNMTEPLRKILDEHNRMLDAATSAKQRKKLTDDYNGSVRDIEAIRDRMRHLFGRPTNPHGLLHRAAKASQQINYIRLLGAMTIAAIPDMGRPIMNYGLTSTFRDGWAPMINSFSTFRLAAREVMAAGTALDMTFDSRIKALAGLADEFQRGTRFERGLETMSSTFGMVSLMAPWNAIMKQMVGTIVMNNIFRAVKASSHGKATAKQITTLASESIDGDMARRIWQQYENKGGEFVDGLYLANTKEWTDEGALTAFRAAIVREVDRTIVTPGQEMPLWMSSDLGRMIGQFKSFSISSSQKTLIAGLQQKDAAFISGSMASLALGGVSTFLRAKAAGYDTSDWTLEKWAVESVDRSGLLTIFSDVNNMAEKFTGGQVGLSAFTGEEASRYRSRNSIGALLGPNFGLVSSGLGLLNAASNGEFSATETKTARRLLPYNTLFQFRLVLDEVEDGFNSALGIPQQKKK